ncbi:MAG: hypothetical protein LBG31_04760 [Prevotellaceae bacterium]|jgi:hypothetical protein|nr:hypothetical protein [Prevotellaceae bacterium]
MEATKEQIAKWKEEHGKLYCIKVDDKVCYLKKPTRKTMGYAMVAGKTNPIKFNEVLLKDCWLGGDEVIKTDDELFFSVSSKFGELVDTKEAELVEL